MLYRPAKLVLRLPELYYTRIAVVFDFAPCMAVCSSFCSSLSAPGMRAPAVLKRTGRVSIETEGEAENVRRGLFCLPTELDYASHSVPSVS